jgi:hypothetical protein
MGKIGRPNKEDKDKKIDELTTLAKKIWKRILHR